MFKKTAISISIFIVFMVSCREGHAMRRVVMHDTIPTVRILAPRSEVVDLTGKDHLTFRWDPHAGSRVRRRYYDFRVYRGTQMLESTLIYNAQVPGDIHRVNMKADMFETGKVYTWSIRQRYNHGGRSRRSIGTFRVTKQTDTK